MFARFRNLFLCFCLLGFVACNEVVIVHDLKERDANEIIVLLSQHGISSKQQKAEKNQEVTWGILVDEKDEIGARQILAANQLPRIRLGGLSGICKDAGLILTPKTEKCREILAFKEEIINSLGSISGVVSADVVLNIPDKEEFSGDDAVPPRATAAVTIQFLKDTPAATALTEQKVQQFVSNSVTSLDERDVAVIINYVESGVPSGNMAETVSKSDATVATTENADSSSDSFDDLNSEPQAEMTSIGGLTMDEVSAKKFKMLSAVFLVLFLLLTVAFIFVLLRMSKLKKKTPVSVEENDDSVSADQKLLKA